MTKPFKELPGLRVKIDDVVYAPHLEGCADRPHPFIYFITIENQSGSTVVIKGRKWVIRDCCGHVTVVEGDGVVGKFPTLGPEERFSYKSYHSIQTDSVAEGSFLGVDEDGTPILVRIPPFTMRVPC